MKTQIAPAPRLMSRPTSAKSLAKANPKLALKWANYIETNKAALVLQIAGKL